MLSQSFSPTIRQRLIENITLLWTITEIPEQPKDNEFRGGLDETRQLTSEREKQLAESFAFISASTDNMRRVMAVCVEEDLDKTGLTIRLASNTGDLSQVVAGLSKIAATLEKAAQRTESRKDIRRDILEQIVILDDARILSRLRSKHAQRSRKTAGRACLLVLLKRTVDDPSIHPQGESAKAMVSSIRVHSKRLLDTFNRFESARESDSTSNFAQNALSEILTQVYELDTEALRTTLQMSASIDPSLKTFLPQAAKKLGHYYCIACDLTDAARSSKYTIFRRISVKALRKPEVKSVYFDESVNFDNTLQRILRLPHHQQPSKSYVSRSLPAARTRFQSHISDHATPRKVHAEIQLLLFYEDCPNIRHPRIVCSNKSACYLCDLFIKIHGKLHTPRTHGRLYDRWVLPERSSTGNALNASTLTAIDRFNATLEDKILHAFDHNQRPFRHPNESSLPFRKPWSSVSTIYKPALSASTAQPLGHVNGDMLRNKKESQPQNLAFADAPTSKGSSKNHLPTVQTSSVEQDLLGVQGLRAERRACLNSSMSTTASWRLSPGERMYFKLTHLSDTCHVQTDAINLHVSYDFYLDEISANSSAKRESCWIQVEWLLDERQNNNDDEKNRPIELNKLDCDQDVTIEDEFALDSKQLFFRNGQHRVLLKYIFDEFKQEAVQTRG